MSSPEPTELPTRGQSRPAPGSWSEHLVDGRIRLVESDPKWPYFFEREARRIRERLQERVLLLEHVGSTSVPGLVAKPCVDLLLCVADPADESAYVPDLEAAGYSVALREPEWYGHRVLKGTEINLNLHVFAHGCQEAERMLLLRDHLRADADARSRYAAVKKELTEHTWDRVQDYADAKSEVVEELLTEAARRPTA
ncbi:GrpB family protein [Nocardiopsis kunsanensis]|uniref:GrpB family protein n=1 Tax=Nocardiopsis kunsanensis TaxID=141693 RepID=A0A918XJQ0_9ACTN|nr:GrpB family protein [Nocardiopsis kunsanensis]GHD34928.1 hypothetical protein GCM10007147_40930 [Nocardiopsis kunsanensis]